MDELRKRERELQDEWHTRGIFSSKAWTDLIDDYLKAGRYCAAEACRRRYDRIDQWIDEFVGEDTPV